MTHLEQLIAEYYDWLGFLVKSNVKVDKRTMGGYITAEAKAAASQALD